MKIDFRQGIISARSITGTPDFLEYNPQNNTMTIDITDTRLVVTAAYKAVNYTYEHRETLDSAFGPLEWKAKWGTEPDKPTYYFYWNFDMGTGQVTLGYSPCDPSYGYTYPANPGIDQHFYNLNEMVMYYYTGSQWIPCIRVFAGSISLNNKVIVHKPFGTQVGFSKALGTMTANEAQTGYIMYGMDMKAIRTQEGTFFTTVTDASTYHGSFSSPIRLELASCQATASEAIPQFYCVTNNGNDTIGLASGADSAKYAIGVSDVPAAQGAAVTYVSDGLLYSDSWNWDVSAGKDLYCGLTGQLIQGMPPTGGSSITQRIGTIIGPRTILVQIDLFGKATGSTSVVTGPTGPTGAAGKDGIAGPTGPQGPEGAGPSGSTNYSNPWQIWSSTGVIDVVGGGAEPQVSIYENATVMLGMFDYTTQAYNTNKDDVGSFASGTQGSYGTEYNVFVPNNTGLHLIEIEFGVGNTFIGTASTLTGGTFYLQIFAEHTDVNGNVIDTDNSNKLDFEAFTKIDVGNMSAASWSSTPTTRKVNVSGLCYMVAGDKYSFFAKSSNLVRPNTVGQTYDIVFKGDRVFKIAYMGPGQKADIIQYYKAVLADAPDLYWRFEETKDNIGSNQIASDSSRNKSCIGKYNLDGNMLDLSITQPGLLAVGSANALTSDRSETRADALVWNTYCSLNDVATLNLFLCDSWTFSGLIKPVAGNQDLGSLISDTDNFGICAYARCDYDGLHSFNIVVAIGDRTMVNGTKVFSSTLSLFAGDTYHVAVTYDATLGTVSLYVNGGRTKTAQLDLSAYENGTAQVICGNSQAGFGAVHVAGDYLPEAAHGKMGNAGQVDEFAVWKSALSPEQIAYHATCVTFTR